MWSTGKFDRSFRLLQRQSRKLAAALFAALLLSIVLRSDRASAAPSNLPTQALDLELQGADVKNVFRLLADVSQRKITLDPCVGGRVDIRLKNTPVPLVFDAFAMKLGLVYEERGDEVIVKCAKDAPISDARLTSKVSLSEREAVLDDVAAHLATAAHLDRVDYRATTHPKITVTLEHVRASTAIAVLSDASGLSVRVDEGRLIVEDAAK